LVAVDVPSGAVASFDLTTESVLRAAEDDPEPP